MAIDRAQKTVVVSVRGTLSLKVKSLLPSINTLSICVFRLPLFGHRGGVCWTSVCRLNESIHTGL